MSSGAPTSDHAGPWRPGERFGPFTVVAPLGRGGMGLVLHARDHAGRDLALKVLTRGGDAGPALERFQREAQVTAGLRHAGIVGVHAAGIERGRPWIAYELIAGGQTLAEALGGGDRARSLELLAQVAEALGHAHEHGVVHRDVKPQNVLVADDGRARVADFGLAQAAGLERLTRTGALVGTPQYMAPEQVVGDREAYGPTTDVWAAGVMLYEALTGQLPFPGPTLPELAAQIAGSVPRRPRELDPSIAPGLETVCLRALAKEPGARYADAGALARDLRCALAGAPLPSAPGGGRAWRPLLALACVSVVVGVGAATQRRVAPTFVDGSPSREERREARRETRQVERLEQALRAVAAEPGLAPVELGRLEPDDLRAVPRCAELLTAAQAEHAARLGALLAEAAGAEAPAFDALRDHLAALEQLARLLPDDAPRFPGADEAANQLLSLLTLHRWPGGVDRSGFRELAGAGARVTDPARALHAMTLNGIGLGSAELGVSLEDGRILAVLYARLDVGFKNGVNLAASPLAAEAAPGGDGPWERYVRLRMTSLPGARGAQQRGELRQLLVEAPPGLELGPVHLAEASVLAAADLPAAERGPWLDAALRADPTSVPVWRALAQVGLELERYDEAAEAAARCLALFRAQGLDTHLATNTQTDDVIRLQIWALAAGDRRAEAQAVLEALKTELGVETPPDLRAVYPWLR